ncbi:MAG: polysaccharide biosynthesis tyrosine autokinase [Chitinispirillaceae bacterium]
MSLSKRGNSGPDNSGIHWEHYLHLIIRKVWFILPVMVVVMVLWVLVLARMGMLQPELEAQAVLRFEDPDNLSAVDERVGDDPESRAVLVTSRSFLEDVVRKLSLQLTTREVPRSSVFDSIAVKTDALTGSYSLEVEDGNYVILYSNRSAGIEDKEIGRGKVDRLDTLALQGLFVRFTEGYREEPSSFQFGVRRVRDAVDMISSSMNVRLSEPSGTIMTITMAGRDYALITEIVNTVARDYVRENSSSKKSRKEEILAILEKQLETARSAMQSSEAALRNFRDANPTVGLPDAMLPPNMMGELRESEADLRSHVLQARSLQQRYRAAGSSNRLPVLNEIIAFLNRHQAATASALQSEFNDLASQQRMYDSAYSPTHPFVRENQNKLRRLGEKVADALNSLTSDLQRRVGENENKINSLHRDLASLPAKEIQYSNLQRRYEVNAEIYAEVLGRYNEARIAGSVDVGDVSLIDLAVEPEGNPDFRILIMVVGAGLFFSMMAGVGPVLVLDFFDRRARTEKDLQRLTHLLLLESIPIKGRWEQRVPSTDTGGIDPKLVSADYSHNFVDETYRSLRTKILLSLFDEKKKRILVTSLNMGEGKSFTTSNLAITMAQQDLRTVLIDGDLRRGIQHRAFGLDKKPGLSNLLMNRDGVDPAMLEEALRRTHIPNLHLLPSGVSVPNSAELINTQRFRDMLKALSERFDVIIMDTPPLAVTTDAVGIQDSFHRYVVVVRAGSTNISHLNKKINEYPGLRKKVLGLVFNGAPYKRPEYYQYNSYRY